MPLITAEEYFGFLFAMVLTFGISFELPIVVLALAALDIVTPQFLSKYRRHAIVAIIVIGAFLTPGDLVWTTIALAVPLYALYELSVVGAVFHLPRETTTSRGAGCGGEGGGAGVKAVVGRWIVAALLGAVTAQTSSAQIIPGRPPIRGAGTLQPARRDTLPDSTAIKWPTPDSVAQSLLNKRDYTITRYQGDTAFFDAERKALDLLAAKKRRAIVDRDSQVVVSDSGIYYSEATRHVTTGGHYVMKPGGGQADITGHGRGDYNLAERSVSVTNARFPVNNGEMWYLDVDRAKVRDRHHRRQEFHAVRPRRIDHELRRLDPGLSLRVPRGEAHRQQHDRGAAGRALHQRRSRDVAAVHLQRHAVRPSQRHSSAAVRRRRHRPQQPHLPPQRRQCRLLLGAERLHGLRHLDRLAELRRRRERRPGVDSLQRRHGLQVDRSLSRRPSRRELHQHARLGSLDEPRDQLGAQSGFFARRAPEHEPQLRLEHRRFSDRTHSIRTRRSRRSRRPATFQNKYGPASLSLGGTRKQYPGRIQVDQTFADGQPHDDADHARIVAELDADAEL